MQEKQSTFLRSIVGHWQGQVQTWFQPGKLADDSTIEGQFQFVGNGSFLRHTYKSTIKGEPRTGETTIVLNRVNGKYQASWFDSFHMNYGLLQSEGEPTENGFRVFGKYAVGAEHPDWGWETVYESSGADQLKITAFNVTPTGEKAKAVEVKYERKK